MPNVVLFSWICNRGPFNGGVHPIDILHSDQGRERFGKDRSLKLEKDYVADHGDGVAIVGELL